MSDPSITNIQRSLSRLKKGLPLFQQDIYNIAWEFTFFPEQYLLLKEIHEHNEKRAESLLIFRKRLLQVAGSEALDTVLDQLFLHYIINTNGPIPESEEEDPFDVFDAAVRYAQTLCISVSKEKNKQAFLHMNGKKVQQLKWASRTGQSAAGILRQIGTEINQALYGRKDIIPSIAFGFDPDRKTYRLKNAMILADFSFLVYLEPEFVEAHVRQGGYETFCWIEDPETDTQVFVAGKEDHLIVCFRGTSNGRDAMVDLNFFKTDAPGGRGRVHRGFLQSLEAVWARLKVAVKDLGADKKIFICGHSLGAAQAQLAAYRLAQKGLPVAGVYVFGSPRVGNQEFKEAYNELLENQTFIHINHEDIVPQIPPQIFGFKHLGAVPIKFDQTYKISGREILMDDDGIEHDFENLDAQQLEEVQKNLATVQTSIKASTQFLNTTLQKFSKAGSGTGFERGAVDDHSMDQYIFKFGCAILEHEWQKLEQKSK